MRIDLTTELTAQQLGQWRDFLVRARTSHPEQDPLFAPVLRAAGTEVAFAMGWQGDDLVAVGMFALRPHPVLKGSYSDAMAYSGPVCDDEATLLSFLQKLQSTTLFRRVGRLRVTPYWLGEEGANLGPVLAGLGWYVFENEPLRHTGMISLEPTETEIYENFSKSARYEFRKAKQQGLTVEHMTDRNCALEVLDLLNKHRRDRNLGTVGQAMFLASCDHIYSKPKAGVFAVVRQEGRIVAGMDAYCGHIRAHGIHYFTVPDELRKLRNLRIAPFIWHHIAVWAKANGARSIDVEGYKADTSENDRLYLVHKYKGDLGAQPVVRVAGHARILNPLLHLTGNLRDIARRQAKAALAMVPRRTVPAAAAAAAD